MTEFLKGCRLLPSDENWLVLGTIYKIRQILEAIIVCQMESWKNAKKTNFEIVDYIPFEGVQ